MLFLRGTLTSKQNVRKIFVLLLWAFALLGLLIFFLPAGSIMLMPLLALPASILITSYFSQARSRKWANLLFLLLLGYTFLIKFYFV